MADFQSDLAGKVLTIEFELSGNRFLAINADSTFKFNEAVSFSVPCEDQQEIDYYWKNSRPSPSPNNVVGLKTNMASAGKLYPKTSMSY